MTATVYYGSHDRKLDYKGRVAIPDDLLVAGTWSRAVLVRDSAQLPDQAPFPFISLYDAARWHELLEAAPTRLGMDVNEMRMFMHTVVADAATVDVDGTKRITIPERLLEHAGIHRQAAVHFIGNFTNIEIWEPELYGSHIVAMEALGVGGAVPTRVELARRVDVHEVS